MKNIVYSNFRTIWNFRTILDNIVKTNFRRLIITDYTSMSKTKPIIIVDSNKIDNDVMVVIRYSEDNCESTICLGGLIYFGRTDKVILQHLNPDGRGNKFQYIAMDIDSDLNSSETIKNIYDVYQNKGYMMHMSLMEISSIT